MDTLPPPPPPPAVHAIALSVAPGDIYPRPGREEALCRRASTPDWAYLAGLAGLDVAAVGFGSWSVVKFSGNVVSLLGPVVIGAAWGATIGGAWLALPKCSLDWVGEPPPAGDVHADWPLALSLALLAGATAPVLYGIAIGPYTLPSDWSDFDRAAHVVVAGVAGFGGALLPYLLPPRTWTASRELRRLRVSAGANGSVVVSFASTF